MKNTYLTIAMVGALKAGYKIMDIYTDPASDFEVEHKADNSPLTIADRKAHEIIVSFLKQTPYPILSEEGKQISYEKRSTWKTLWIVDPLDGTKEFIKRNGEFTVNIALVKQGEPVAGIIYVPVTNVMYVAWEEESGKRVAYKLTDIKLIAEDGKERLSYSSQSLPCVPEHRGLVVVASRSHLSAETKDFIEKLKQQNRVELITSGSSLKICLVAEGAADIYPRFAPTMEWDTAAGHAIALATGCQLYQYESDKPLYYNKEDLLNPWFIARKVQTLNN